MAKHRKQAPPHVHRWSAWCYTEPTPKGHLYERYCLVSGCDLTESNVEELPPAGGPR